MENWLIEELFYNEPDGEYHHHIIYDISTFSDDLENIRKDSYIKIIIKNEYINFINEGIKFLKNFKNLSFEIYLENMDIFNKLYEAINESKLIKDFSLSIDIYNNPPSYFMSHYSNTIILHTTFLQLETFKLNNLYDLDLYSCKINKLPSTFNSLGIEDLNLGNNCFEKFPDVICGLKNLKILKMCKNKLYMLPDTLKNLKNLKTLDIAYNNFIDFPKIICKLKNLERLYISNNNINKIPFEITKLNLKILNYEKHDNIFYDLQNLDFNNNFGNLINGLYRLKIKIKKEKEKEYKNKRLVFRLYFLINKNNKILNFKIIKNILKY